MKQDKATLDSLSFHPENNLGRGDWDTDWNTMRRYCSVGYGLRVWEGGIIDLITDTAKDTYTRIQLSHKGIDVRIKKDLPTLFAPRTDRKITKSSLLSDYFLVDERSRRVLCLDRNWKMEYIVRWVHHNSIPFAAARIQTRERNFKREKEFLATHKELFIRADAVLALEGGWGTATTPSKDFATYKTPAELLALGLFRKQKSAWEEWLIAKTADKRQYKHLTLRPNEL